MNENKWQDRLFKITKESACLILGVTGGIATGKTTVARMLVEKGALLIDFDDLAREAVLPGRPAHQEIVAFFGNAVLKPDQSLDRKKLANLVFRSPEIREKLEGMVHPRVNELFMERVEGIIPGNPGAIILADIPLLIELNLQGLFRKILLVYAAPEIQVQRLMARDGIGEGTAARIIKNQLPIDSKKAFADFIIQNGGSLSQTRQQVDVLWPQLLELQKKKE